MKNYKDIFKRAIQVFGCRPQKIVAIEELSELQKEICKDLRGMPNYEHIAEEIADVEIMIDQLKMMYSDPKADGKNFELRIELFKAKKAERLKVRIEDALSNTGQDAKLK